MTLEAILLFLILVALVGIIFIALRSLNKQQLHLAGIESALKNFLENFDRYLNNIQNFDRYLNNIQQSLQRTSQEEQHKLTELKQAVEALQSRLDHHLNSIQQSIQNASQTEQQTLIELKQSVDTLRQSIEESIKFD